MKGRRRAVLRWAVTSVAIVAGVAAFALILALTGTGRDGRTAGGSSGASASAPRWSGPLLTMGPGQIALPEGADCGACHILDSGGVGVRTIPVVAHPLHGWTECTSCHSDETLVKTAPGHTGVHKSDCLVCHNESTVPVPTPRHPTLPDADCLGCHGTIAPLPSSMRDRPKELCWLCHHE